MTDAEIIKALECEAVPSDANCIHSEYIEAVGIYCHKKKQHAENCHDCEEHRMAYYGKKAKATLDLINRQKAEIERLERLNGDLVKIADTRKKANFSLLSEKLSLTREMRVAKVEAIKEFVEAFKVKFAKERYRDNYVIDDEMLDNLVKEMVGDTE